MTAVDRQVPLVLPARSMPVPVEQIRAQPSMTRALVLAQDASGKQDKAIAIDCGLDPGQWARIKSGQSHFPHDRWETFFEATGNEIPLVWLADRRGYDLVRQQTELERENAALREQVDRMARDLDVVKQIIREARG